MGGDGQGAEGTEQHPGKMPGQLAARLKSISEGFFADAAEVDSATAIPSDHFRALSEAGLYGPFAPTELGGLGLDVAGLCDVVEELASSCLATTLVWIQHFGLLAALLDPSVPEPLRALLPGVIGGELKSGIVFTGLLPGPPKLAAEPAGDGWLIEGEAPFVSGWGVIDHLLVAARAPDETVVRLVIEARETAKLSAKRLHLSALNASCTMTLRFAGLFVPEDHCAGRQRFDPTSQDHVGLRTNGSLALGVARRCCQLLGPSPLDEELAAKRRALDSAGPTEMASARAGASFLAVGAAHALAVSSGSKAVLAGDVAERLSREAASLLVFGSRPAIKQDLLARFTSSPS